MNPNMFSPCAIGHQYGVEWPPNGGNPIAVCRRCGTFAPTTTIRTTSGTTPKEQPHD